MQTGRQATSARSARTGPRPAPSRSCCARWSLRRMACSSLAFLVGEEFAGDRVDHPLHPGAVFVDRLDLVAAALDLPLADFEAFGQRLGLDRVLAHPLALRRIAAARVALGERRARREDAGEDDQG